MAFGLSSLGSNVKWSSSRSKGPNCRYEISDLFWWSWAMIRINLVPQVTWQIHMSTTRHTTILCSMKVVIVSYQSNLVLTILHSRRCQESIALPEVEVKLMKILCHASHLECKLLEGTGDYYRLLEITGDYWRLLEIIRDYWRSLQITRDHWKNSRLSPEIWGVQVRFMAL